MNDLIRNLYSSFSIPGLRLGIIFGLIILFTLNILSSNEENLNSFISIKEELKIYENWPEEKVQLLGEINELKRQVSMAGSDIYSFDQDNEYFGQLFKFCEENNIQIDQWGTGEIKMNPHHVAVTLEIGMNGKPQSLLKLLHEMEWGSNPAEIKSIHLIMNPKTHAISLKSNLEILFKR